MTRLFVVALLIVAACKPVDVVLLSGVDGGPVPIDGLRALRVTPQDAPVLVDRGAQARTTFAFRALGVFDDGERDVTTRVGWRLGNAEMGTIVDGHFTSAGVAGDTFVEARVGAFVATAPLTVHLDVFVDQTPAQVGDILPIENENDLTGPAAPVVIYPSDGAVVPANVGSLEPQWSAAPEHDLYELRIESEVVRVRVVTTERSLAIDGPLAWVLLSHVGRAFDIYVRAASNSAPNDVYRSARVRVRVASSGIEGVGSFWATQPPAVLRAQFGSLRVQQQYPFASSGCTGCHAVSRDGRRLATTGGSERITIVDLAERTTRNVRGEYELEWASFNPWSTRFAFVDEGRLRIANVASAEVQAVTFPQGSYAAHPDWSPDGTFLVIAYSQDEKPEGYRFRTTSIARMDVDANGELGPPVVLVERGPERVALGYPSISWDGRYVAYARVDGGEGLGDDAVIEVVRSDGSGAPIVLTTLDERVGPDDGVTDLRNIMPTWLPSEDPSRQWLAFSSERAYGHRLAAGTRAQLWLASIDPARLDSGLDGSSPATWVPFQSMASSNYRLQWAAFADAVCDSIVEVCNDLDDDCDDVVDEDCCTPSGDEVCGNLVDDDCDGLVDETCTCDGPEICDNGLDDDCDRAIDLADRDC